MFKHKKVYTLEYIVTIFYFILQIEADFEILYPGKDLSIFNNWETFFQKVKSLKAPSIIKNKDPVLDDILIKLEDETVNLTEGNIK